ncbi:MAG: endolytic transglycosylase MltG [Clostridia bacterium]|nr:endolytic transglycosylase MltG [Clostridia bacterium]
MLSNKVKFALKLFIVLALLVVFAVVGLVLGYNYVIVQSNSIDNLKKSIESGEFEITEDTDGCVPIVIKIGDSTSDIAQTLYDNKLIDNTLIFSLLSKINGFDGAYLAGTHYLIPGLKYDELMYLLTLRPESVTITFQEGMTYEQIKAKLHENGLTFSDAEFDACMDSPNLFVDYEFVSQIKLTDGRDHVLAGYLFPDTYEFDINASAQSIINTFLRNTEVKLYDEYYERAKALGMSLDEVITLASLIQYESNSASEMMLISAVFHNRLNSDDESLHYLGSDASVNYLRQLNGLEPTLNLSQTDISSDSPYNTFNHPGLPPGPICMPGLDAIQAALYPEPNCNYYYFCATGDGNSVFAVTYDEHLANIEMYKDNWN